MSTKIVRGTDQEIQTQTSTVVRWIYPDGSIHQLQNEARDAYLDRLVCSTFDCLRIEGAPAGAEPTISAVLAAAVPTATLTNTIVGRQCTSVLTWVLPYTMATNGLNGLGFALLDFPDGIIKINWTLVRCLLGASGAGWAGVEFGLGSVTAANDNALTATEDDIVVAAVSGALGATPATVQITRLDIPTTQCHNGSTTVGTPLTVYLNVADATMLAAAQNLAVSTATIVMNFDWMGDY